MHQSHKMVKHTQTIRWEIAYELCECVSPFCEIGTKRVKESSSPEAYLEPSGTSAMDLFFEKS